MKFSIAASAGLALAGSAIASPLRTRGAKTAADIIGEIASSVRVELAERGARLTGLDTLDDAFELLAGRHFDVVVVNPFIGGGCGRDFIDAINGVSDSINFAFGIGSIHES